MERRGGCCIARYAGGSQYGYNVSNVDRIMLRFRPIAPKPTSAGSVSPPDSGAKIHRGKRKYTKKNGGCANKCNNKRRKASSSPEEKRSDGSTGSAGSWSGSVGEFESPVTLTLLPEAPVHPFVPQNTEANKSSTTVTSAPTWLCFGEGRRRRAVEAWVTVECVTETWVEGKELGSTDEERRMSLERDTCPGFGSDGVGRVRWTNEAYRKMVGQGDDVEVMVWLAMKERVRVMLMYLPAFACRVRMQYRRGKEMRSMTVPCDAWRMDGGGFAWRLDVKAALTL